MDAVVQQVGTLQRAGALADPVAETLRQRYAERRARIHAELEALYRDKPEVAEAHTREALRQVLHTEREAVRDLAAKGQISADTLDDLIKEIDGELEGLEHMTTGIEPIGSQVKPPR